MNVKIEKYDNRVIISLDGRLDMKNAATLEEYCKDLLDTPNSFIFLDLDNLDYIGSAGIKSLVWFSRKINPLGSKIYICRPRDSVKEILEISGLNHVLTIMDTLPEDASNLSVKKSEDLTLPLNSSSILNFQSIALKFAESNNVSPKVLPKIELILEEILLNIFHHAYQGIEAPVTLRYFMENNFFGMEFTDSGPAFNPLTQSEPDLDPRSEDRQIGGLGIYLVKKTSDKAYYKYVDKKNILSLFLKKD